MKSFFDGFFIALRAELFIAMRNFSSKLILLAPAMIAILQQLLTKLTEAGRDARDGIFGSNEFDEAIASNAYGYFVDGMGTGLTVLGLLLVAQAAYSFSYDRDTGMLRHLIIRRISRSGLILAKLVQLHLLALISLIILLFSSYFCSGSLWEFGPIIEDGFELISEEEILFEISLGLKLAIIPLPAAIAFGVLVSVCSNSATQALASALGITLAVDIFKSLLGGYSNYLYASYQPSLLNQSYLQDVGRIVRGYSDVLIDEKIQQLNLWVPWPALLVFLAITLIIIQRRNI